jgi:membrane protein implicated in regulation of membrane protease activity
MTSSNGGNPARKRTAHPYRDTVFVYGGFAVLVVVLAVVTGGNIWWALAAAAGAFVLAVGWTWRQLRLREQAERRKA